MAPRREGALCSLFDTGKRSDLTVVFKVHKAVVCPQIPFLHAACAGKFKEAEVSRIDLVAESETTVRALLQSIYGVDVDLLRQAWPPTFAELESQFRDVVNILIAADKYHVSAIEVAANNWFFWATPWLFVSNTILMDLGSWLYGHELYDLPNLTYVRMLARCAMRAKIPAIVKSEEAWAGLYSNENFLREILSQEFWTGT